MPDAPNDLPVERELGHFAILDVAHVEELLFAFLADGQAVPAAVELLAEGADEAAGLVEDGDGVHRLLGGRLMREVDQPGLVENHAVRIAPMDMLRQRAPIVRGFVGMFARCRGSASCARLVVGTGERRADGGGGGGGGSGGQELAAGELCGRSGFFWGGHDGDSRGEGVFLLS